MSDWSVYRLIDAQAAHSRCSEKCWTPADVEAETLAGYSSPWPSNPWLDAWNRAVVLGGEHYAKWRAARIGPVERAIEVMRGPTRKDDLVLRRGRITELVLEQEREDRAWARIYARMPPEERVHYRTPDCWTD